jgi:fucose permease
MGISRILYGKFGEKVDLSAFMIFSGILCVGCYLLAGLGNAPAMGLIGCALCGFSVGIMWPGSISIASKTIPKGGTAMFALLALAGDLGGTVAPTLVGNISQMAGDNLKAGIFAGIVFPIGLVLCVLAIRRIWLCRL